MHTLSLRTYPFPMLQEIWSLKYWTMTQPRDPVSMKFLLMSLSTMEARFPASFPPPLSLALLPPCMWDSSCPPARREALTTCKAQVASKCPLALPLSSQMILWLQVEELQTSPLTQTDFPVNKCPLLKLQLEPSLAPLTLRVWKTMRSGSRSGLTIHLNMVSATTSPMKRRVSILTTPPRSCSILTAIISTITREEVPTDRISAKNIHSLNIPRNCRRKSLCFSTSEVTLKAVKNRRRTSLRQ